MTTILIRKYADNHDPGFMTLPTLEDELFTENGERGWIGAFYTHEDNESMTPVGGPIGTRVIDETRIFFRYELPQTVLLVSA